ncbi:hypothetical protein V8C35DRAFT_296487 [Trichoderma chlorosporum]
MQRDPSGKGFMHLGKDGVLRTLSAEHKVVDAKGLNPGQIKQMLDSLPVTVDKEEFDGVDGTTLPEEQWYSPAAGILPQKSQTDAERGAQQKAMKEANGAHIPGESGTS